MFVMPFGVSSISKDIFLNIILTEIIVLNDSVITFKVACEQIGRIQNNYFMLRSKNR